MLITTDTAPGDYVLAIEDVVEDSLVQRHNEQDRQRAMLERHKEHALRLSATEQELEEALSAAPAPSEDDPEGTEHETVVAARAALAEAQQPIPPISRPLCDLAGMLRQVPRLSPYYVPFTVIDHSSGIAE